LLLSQAVLVIILWHWNSLVPVIFGF
jgi:hypothetical protein